MYRALGIPARYTVGFVVQTTADEFVDIMTPGHAWVEIYMDGIGWMQVEVTGGYGGLDGGFSADEEAPQVIEIQPEYQYKKYDGKPLYAQPQIVGDISSLLAQGYTYKATVSGSQTEIGLGESKIEEFRLFDPDGNDVTDLFTIVRHTGILEVLPPDIIIIPVYLYQLQKYYDGKTLAFEDGDFEFLDLPKGVTVELMLNIELTDIGHKSLSILNAEFEKYAQYRVYKTDTMEDVTEKYRIIFEKLPSTHFYYPIRVEKRNITITAESATKQYDGTPLTSANAFISVGSLVEGHRMEYVTMGSQTGPGTKLNEVVYVAIYDENGCDVTKNYKISTQDGILTVIDPD